MYGLVFKGTVKQFPHPHVTPKWNDLLSSQGKKKGEVKCDEK